MTNKKQTNQKTDQPKNPTISFNPVTMHLDYFKFSFAFDGGNYECLYKRDLKGIAAEKFLIGGKEYRIGVKRAQSIANFSDEQVELILSERLKILRQLRGDESSVDKLQFELDELNAKLQIAVDRVKKIEAKIQETEKLLNDAKNVNQADLDVKQIITESKQKRIEQLKQELAALEN